jgi:hypothetical protein
VLCLKAHQWVYPQGVGVDSFFPAARKGLSEELSRSFDVKDGLDLLTWTLPEETEKNEDNKNK